MKTLLLILQYMPLVQQAVKEAEASGVPGADKKQMVLAAVLAAAHAGQQVPNATVMLISSLIDTFVGVMFGKAGTATVQVPAIAPSPAK